MNDEGLKTPKALASLLRSALHLHNKENISSGNRSVRVRDRRQSFITATTAEKFSSLPFWSFGNAPLSNIAGTFRDNVAENAIQSPTYSGKFFSISTDV